MSQIENPIICDGCGRDITYTGNSIDYRLILRAYSPKSKGGAVTDMMMYPTIEGDRHFCNSLRCVGTWLNAIGVKDANTNNTT